jgi:type III secretion system low calcium response chaperone LcrH/SycD
MKELKIKEKMDESLEKLGEALIEPEREKFQSQVESFEAYKARRKEELRQGFQQSAELYRSAYLLIDKDIIPAIQSKKEQETLINEIIVGQKHLMELIGTNEWPSDKTFQEILGYSGHTLELFYLQGLSYFDQGAYQNGVALFSLLVLINPGYNHFWVGLGMCHQALTHWEEALRAYSMARLTDPNDPLCHLYASECQSECHNLPEAKEEIDKAMELMDNSHDHKYDVLKKLAIEWKRELSQKVSK